MLVKYAELDPVEDKHIVVGGGTESGLNAVFLKRIAGDYCKKSNEIYSFPKICKCIVEPYKVMLTTHWLLDHTEVSIVLDNEAIYNIWKEQVAVDRQSYCDLNMLIAIVI